MNDKAAFGFSNALVTRSWQTFVNLVKNGDDSVTKISNYLDGLICRIVVNNDDFELPSWEVLADGAPNRPTNVLLPVMAGNNDAYVHVILPHSTCLQIRNPRRPRLRWLCLSFIS